MEKGRILYERNNGSIEIHLQPIQARISGAQEWRNGACVFDQ